MKSEIVTDSDTYITIPKAWNVILSAAKDLLS